MSKVAYLIKKKYNLYLTTKNGKEKTSSHNRKERRTCFNQKVASLLNTNLEMNVKNI